MSIYVDYNDVEQTDLKVKRKKGGYSLIRTQNLFCMLRSKLFVLFLREHNK